MKKICICLLVSCIALPLFAQDSGKYKTKRLEGIANLLSVNPERLTEGYHQLPDRDGHSLQLHVSKNGIVDHIGLKLFNRDNVDDKDMTVIFDFTERYLLELVLIDNWEQSAKRMEEDKVTLDYVYFSDLKKISDTLLSEITRFEDKGYSITWKEKGKQKNTFGISFPIQYELILGMNKIEIEDGLQQSIQNQENTIREQKPVHKTTLFPVPQTNYYIKQGAMYMISELSANLYYIKEGANGFRLLHNPDFPIETLANLMTTNEIENDYQLSITQNKYGYNAVNYTASLKQWLNYCFDSGCTAYFGLEAQDEEVIKATVVMENKELAYNHILYIDFNKSCLNKRNGTIKAKLNSFIPTHNLTDLYYEKSDKAKSKQQN